MAPVSAAVCWVVPGVLPICIATMKQRTSATLSVSTTACDSAESRGTARTRTRNDLALHIDAALLVQPRRETDSGQFATLVRLCLTGSIGLVKTNTSPRVRSARMIRADLTFQPLRRPVLSQNRHRSARKGTEHYVSATFDPSRACRRE